MSTVTKQEPNEKQYSEPTIGGDFIVNTAKGYAWRCEGCGLVWDRKGLAKQCEEHGHSPLYTVAYGGYYMNGHHVGGREYERRAIRRDKLPATTTVAAIAKEVYERAVEEGHISDDPNSD